MNISARFRWPQLLFVPPVEFSAAVLFWAVTGKAPPAKVERGESTPKVRIIEAPKLDLVPRAERYGAVKPARVWTAVAQVGRVVDMHPSRRTDDVSRCRDDLIFASRYVLREKLCTDLYPRICGQRRL